MVAWTRRLGAASLALAIRCGAVSAAHAAGGVFVPAGDLSDPAQARDFMRRVTQAAGEVCARTNRAHYVSMQACVAAAREEAFDQLRPAQRRQLGLSPWPWPWPAPPPPGQ